MGGISPQAWFKIISSSAILCIGGPALVMWVQPTPEELFSRFNPDLQARALANKDNIERDYDDFVCKLKEFSKSDKPIWIAAAEAEQKEKEDARREILGVKEELERRRGELRAMRGKQ